MTDTLAQMALAVEQAIIRSFDGEAAVELADETWLRELGMKVVAEAMFQPRRVKESTYGPVVEYDSPAMEAARQVAEKTMVELADRLLADLKSDPRFQAALSEALAAALPAVVKDLWQGYLEAEHNRTVRVVRDLIVEDLEKAR